MTDKAAREMTFEEEAKLYKEETAEFSKSETVLDEIYIAKMQLEFFDE